MRARSAQDGADNIAAAWEKITDGIGRDNQIMLYQASLGEAPARRRPHSSGDIQSAVKAVLRRSRLESWRGRRIFRPRHHSECQCND